MSDNASSLEHRGSISPKVAVDPFEMGLRIGSWKTVDGVFVHAFTLCLWKENMVFRMEFKKEQKQKV